MYPYKLLIIFLLSSLIGISASADDNARELIQQVVKANGGVEKLHALKDVSYEYTFRSMEKGISDVSVERYIFDGEVSFAQYTQRQYYMLPDLKGVHTQFFDAQQTTSKMGQQKITDQQAAYVGHFFRKTNYYWFAMMFKLSDPGINYKTMPDRTVDGIAYKIVEMSFEQGVGETSDRYILYINPRTKRIDQFLFTVKGFGLEDPSLMKVKYEKINGLYLSTYRKYAPADWDGNVVKEEWNEQISKNIQFNNGFTKENITSPFLQQAVKSSYEVNNSAKEVWQLVSDWNNLNKLVPEVVARTEVKGKKKNASWDIYLKNGKVVKEQMVVFDKKKKMMSYKMTETPMPLQNYLATIQVNSIDKQKCQVIFSTAFDVEEKDREELLTTFQSFQNTYLANIEAAL